MADEIAELALELRRHLAWQEAEGGRLIYRDASLAPAVTVPAPPARPAPVAAPPERAPEIARPPPPAAPPRPVVEAPAPALATAHPELEGRTLDEVRTVLGDCQRCKLGKGRVNLVYGVGNPRAQLLFVGEGPGQEEDLQGVPFVGKAGQLLTKMIEAMGFTRDQVYICNVVKCRPPNNRNPEPDEIGPASPSSRRSWRRCAPR